MDVARIFAAALHRAPRLQLVAVVPRYPDVEKRLYPEAARLGHGEALAMVREASGDRMQVLDVENHQGWPVYVHARLCVVDDVWALVGGANLNMRSWTHDSEVAVAVLDDDRDPRTPADPGGLGDGARRFARGLSSAGSDCSPTSSSGAANRVVTPWRMGEDEQRLAACVDLLAGRRRGRVQGATPTAASAPGSASLERDIRSWVQRWNDNPHPFAWTRTADEILERLAAYLDRIPGGGH